MRGCGDELRAHVTKVLELVVQLVRHVRCHLVRRPRGVAAVKEGAMIRETLTLVALLAVVVVPGAVGCGGPDLARRDHIHQTELRDVRLGDGVPLAFSLSLRRTVR